MNLGAFSVSLVVKDIEASRAFYELFGFKEAGGDASQENQRGQTRGDTHKSISVNRAITTKV